MATRNFTVMRPSELPDEWKRPADQQHFQIIAQRLGIQPSEVDTHICVEVPDTQLGRLYQAWHIMHNDPDSLPVAVINFHDFMHYAGPQRLSEFDHAIRTTGRPCHIIRIDGQKPP